MHNYPKVEVRLVDCPDAEHRRAIAMRLLREGLIRYFARKEEGNAEERTSKSGRSKRHYQIV